jgi:PAS domain S-box-containing protein
MFLAVREAALAGVVGPQPDFRIIRPDGEIRVLHNEYSVDRDADGKLLRLFGTVQDVTERTRIEDEVRRGRETLARAQRVASIGSFEHDLVQGRIEWSDQLYQLYGLDPQRDRGNIDVVIPMVHPDDLEKFRSVREQPANGISSAAIDFRVTLPDGTQRIFHRECDVTFDGMGKPIRVFGVVQDVTERKNIEIELRRSRENLARAQRLAGIGSFDHDLVTGKREFSDEFMRIWGLESVPAGPLREILRPMVHPEDRAKFHEMREAAFQNRPVPPWDFRIVRPDGAERIVHPETRVVFDAGGKPIRMYGTVQDITERKQIELELRRSREQLARAHQVAGIGSFARDLVTGELEWSEEFLHIWGINEKPTRGTAEQLLSLVHPEDREKFVDGRNAALERKALPALDFRITRPDGQERILHREYGVVFDDAGKPVRMFGTVQDITERKQIELELRRSRENLARAQRIAGMGSFDHDLITGQDEWSDELYHLYGLTPGHEGSKVDLVWLHIHPEDREKFVLFREEVTKGIRSIANDFRVIRTDGAERIFHRECDIVFDEAGKPIRIFGTVQDVTERKKAEIELLRSRENLARAQRFAGMGSFERDLSTNQSEWSEEMYHILGVDTTNAVPGYEQQLKFIHPDDRKTFLDYRTAEITGEPSRPIEYRIIRPDGVERIVRRESAVAFDENKKAIRIYGTLQDVTERRVAERRERELERQLLHSQKLEALGTLAGGIAHDLNNTLVPIMALSKLTSRRFEAGSLVQSNLETIYEASVRARDLVKRVVAFSRKDESEKRSTDVAEIVNEALKLLRATVPSSIALETRIAKVPPIPADASQIHQVVTNLVANASHAIGSEMGKVTVTLDLRTSAAQGAEICLSVSDTGAGMDATTQERIFEPFFTTKPVGQGTGLGLSIVHGIVTGHNGRIEVKSAPGEGTRFDLYFPVSAGSALTSSRPAA